MKKLTALLLALCMLLAAVPALGEDLSGSWYIVLEDVNIGQFDLKADGTAAMHMAAGEKELNYEGTWESRENGIAVTFEGETLEMAYDAETDTISSSLFPVPVQREQGKYDVQLIMDVINGKEVELPEGVEQADVLMAAAKFMASAMALSSTQSGTDGGSTGTDDGGSTGTPGAAAGGTGLDVLAENFVVTESYSGYEGTYIAKVQNNTGSPLWLTSGSLAVKDASGNLVATRDYLSTCASKYLEPGEISAITISVDLEQAGEYSYEANIKAEESSYRGTDVNVPAADPAFADGKYDSKVCRVTIANEADSNMTGLNVAYLLSDGNGLPVALFTEALYNHELGPKSTIVMVSSLYSRLVDYLKANSITPTVEAFAWVENDD